MKKLFSGFFITGLIFLLTSGLSAQNPAAYEFSSRIQAPYTPLDSDNAILLNESAKVKGTEFKTTFFNATERLRYPNRDTSLDGIPIPFDFIFDGQICDKFVAAGTGFILLSPKTDTKVIISGSASMAFGWFPTIGIGVNNDVSATQTTQIRYAEEGEENDRVLVVEFVGLQHASGSETFNYQIKLYERDSKIEILFDDYTVPDNTYVWGVGLEGKSGTYHLEPAGNRWADSRRTPDGWTNKCAGTVFEEGLVFSFTPPPACTKPDRTILNMDLQATDREVTGTITLDTDGHADGYIVFASEKTFSGQPADGQDYAKGDHVANGIVLAKDELKKEQTEISFSHKNLNPNTPYHYTAYLYNDQCTGTKYGNSSKDSLVTSTLPPAALHVSGLTDTSITLSVTANEWNESVMVAVTDQIKGRSRFLFGGDFGIPASGLSEGDTIYKEDGGFGGKIVYRGPASEPVVYRNADMPDNTPFFFAAFSFKDDDSYSYEKIETDTITPARLPFYEDFSRMQSLVIPRGWSGTSGFLVGSRKYGTVEVQFRSNSDSSTQEADLVFPAMDFSQTQNLRLVFDYCMYYENGMSYSGLNAADWPDNDSIVFEVSAGQEDSYRTVYAITRLNADGFSWYEDFKKRTISLRGAGGTEQTRLRIRYVSAFEKAHYLVFKYFKLEPIATCDYPAMVAVPDSTIAGDKAIVRWTGGESNESVWNLAYAMKNTDGTWGKWISEGEVTGSSYVLEGLETNRTCKVRMQAVCGTGSVSQWVETEEFSSGWTPAFIEDFNRPEGVFSGGIQTGYKLPAGWASRKYSGSSIPASLDFRSMVPITQPFYNWKAGKDSIVIPGQTDIAVTFPTIALRGITLLRLPSVEVKPEENPWFVFDWAYGKIDGHGRFQKADTAGVICHDKMFVWISTDEGRIFFPDSAVRTYDFAELAAKGDSSHARIDLSGYKGKVTVAFGIYTFENDHTLYIDNAGIIYECPSAKFLKLREESLGEHTAEITWREDPTKDEWTVILREDGKEIAQTVRGNRLAWDTLRPATTYTVYVGQPCADTAKWNRISFVTGGVPCHAVSDIALSAISRNTAELRWNGAAVRYRIRIRPVSEKGGSWTEYETTSSPYVLRNLIPGTLYEGGIQSVCGLAASDTSLYTDFPEFRTDAITCFPPENIEVSNKNHYSALVVWDGEAESWQIEHRREGAPEIEDRITIKEPEGLLENLEAATMYEFRVRSICAAGDTSGWSAYINFTTEEAPDCPAPTDLNAEVLSPTAARLSWKGEEGASFIVRFSQASPISWDSTQTIEATFCELQDLEPETLYLWTVMSSCRGGKNSSWAQRARFETLPLKNANDIKQEDFILQVSEGQIHIVNPSNLRIDRIRLYRTDGRLHGEYKAGYNGNMILTTRAGIGIAIVEIESQKQYFRYKILLP